MEYVRIVIWMFVGSILTFVGIGLAVHFDKDDGRATNGRAKRFGT
jgi:hypothetical protein